MPDCHRPAEEPIVTALFGYSDGLGFMAGGAYPLGTVQVAARFDGEREHVEGDYVLVMFEDETVPIIGGREFLGAPKIERLWLGKSGQVYFGDPGEEDVAYTKRVVDALKMLPVRQVTQTPRLRGSALLRYDLSERLR